MTRLFLCQHMFIFGPVQFMVFDGLMWPKIYFQPIRQLIGRQ